MIGIEFLKYLLAREALSADSFQILDIGSQNLISNDPVAFSEVAKALGVPTDDPTVAARLDDLSRRATVIPGQQTTYLAELMELAPNIQYISLDIAPGYKTTLFDFNRDTIPPELTNRFDLVLNFGTSEHVMDQVRLYKAIHSTLKVGGLWFEQLPTFGWCNHGYYTYHPDFYRDFAAANEYDIVDMFYTLGGDGSPMDESIPFRQVGALQSDTYGLPASMGALTNIQFLVLNVMMRKSLDAPMRLPLEMRTAHARAGKDTEASYGSGVVYGS